MSDTASPAAIAPDAIIPLCSTTWGANHRCALAPGHDGPHMPAVVDRDSTELGQADVEQLDPLAALGIPPFVSDMARSFGLDLGELAAAMSGAPDDPTLLDVIERVDQLAEQLDRIEQLVAPVERIIAALDAAAPKLRRLGVSWQS